MPDADDTTRPPPLPPAPLSDRELLERMEQWIGRIARSTGSQALTLKQFADGVREDLGQLQGGVLVLDGAMGRLERHTRAILRYHGIEQDALAAGGELTQPPEHRTPTDQFDLPGGVAVEVPKRSLKRWRNVIRIGKGIGTTIGLLVGALGWILHLLRHLHR